MNPKVSICIPNYNSEKYIAFTLESILGQSYQDFQVSIIDNCSTDDSLGIIKKFKDPRISVVKNKNHVTITENFNNCVNHCQTEYLCIMHADDVYETEYLKTMIEGLDQHPESGLAYCNFRVIDDQNRTIDDIRSSLKYQRFPSSTSPFFVRPPLEELSLLLIVPYIICPSVMYRKNIFDRVGLFDTSYQQVEDWDFFIRVLWNQYPFLFVNKKLFFNRVHNSTTNINRKSLVKYKEHVSLVTKAYHQLALKKLEVSSTLRQAYQQVFQIVLWDIKEDLLKRDHEGARKKYLFLRESVPIYNNFLSSYSLMTMIGLGRNGGIILDKLAKFYLSLKK